MLNRRIVAPLAALSAVAAVNLLAACTPSDDNDAFATPTPEEPAPLVDTICQIVWTSQQGDGSVDAFAIEAPAEYWAVGGTQVFAMLDTAMQFEEGFVGLYQPGAAIDHGIVDMLSFDDTGAFAVGNTNGDFVTSVTFNGTADGADIDVSDVGGEDTTLLMIDTAGEITEDTVGWITDIMFDGFWTAKGSETPDLATGSVTLVLGTDLLLGNNETITLGDFGSWAICYDVPVE